MSPLRAAGVLLLALAVRPAAPPPFRMLERRSTAAGLTIPYTIQIPPAAQGRRDFPILMALHGGGSRGTDGAAPRTQSVAAAARRHPERYPAILVLPQCPPDAWWSGAPLAAALAALDATLADHGGDRDRLYVTGQSMGGEGALRAAAARPGAFAAAMAVCPAPGAVELAPRLGTLPVWVFHGETDRAVPVTAARALVAALRRAGSAPRYTEYPGAGHDIWEQVYEDPAVPAWLFAQRRGGTASSRTAMPVAAKGGRP